MISVQGEKEKLRSSIYLSASFVVLIWGIHIFDFLIADLSAWGVLPRKISGLWGILFYPLLHSDWGHLFSNSVPMFVLGFLTLYSYRKVALSTISSIYFFSGIGIWLFARQSIHLGASGLVYGLAFFLAFSGFFRRDIAAMAISALVVFLYGGIVWGLLPIKPQMSFEGHIAGAVVGVACAWVFKEVNKVQPHVWNDPPDNLPIVEEPFWKKEEEIPEGIPEEYKYLFKKDK